MTTSAPVQQSVLIAALVFAGLSVALIVHRFGAERASMSSRRSRLVGLRAAGDRTVDVGARIGAVVARLGPVRWWLAQRADRQRQGLLPDFVEAVARALSAGASLSRALEEAGEAVGEPFDLDMARLSSRTRVGVSLIGALGQWADEAGGDGVRLFVTACVLGAESGRGTAEALSGVADTLADQRDVVAEAHALSSQARASAVMLVALPLVFSVGVALISPATTRLLLTTPLGLVCLAAGVSLDLVGGLWMRRLARRVM